MMGFGFGDGISSLLWSLSMLVSMLMPVVIIVGVVYLGLSLFEGEKKCPLVNMIHRSRW